MKQPNKTGRDRGARRGERSEYAPREPLVGGHDPMNERRNAKRLEARDVDLVAKRLRDIQRGKRGRVRWGISRHTAERAIEAIQLEEKAPYRRSSKARRRKRSKRLL